MWRHLRLTGLGVIEEAALDFGPGLTVITGETGAGKTMIVTALGLLRGERADSGLVRIGSRQARIEAEIDVSAAVRALVEDASGEIEDDIVLLSRVLTDKGRSRAYAGGAAVPASLLASISEHSVAVHGQSDQYRLLRPSAQRSAVDEFAGDSLSALLNEYRTQYGHFARLKERLEAIRGSAQERAREIDQLSYGLDEIAEVAPEPGEDKRLLIKSERLTHVQSLFSAAQSAHRLVSGDDEESAGVLTWLAHAAAELERVVDHDPSLADLARRMREVTYSVSDLGADLASYLSGLDLDPAQIEAVEQRRSELLRLVRKYGDDIDGVLAWAEGAARRMAEIDVDDTTLNEMDRELSDLSARLLTLAEGLTAKRREAAAHLAEAVAAELVDLAMPQARMDIVVTAPSDPGVDTLGPDGHDAVEFWFSANAGAEPRPLARGASGGELSRVMLALEVVLVGSRQVPTLVFDEVDAGIGGKAAVEVGRRLARLARHAQVFAVTHLPQVAAFADHHFHVAKSHDGTVTRSSVLHLDGEARVEELSRMLAGQDDSASAQQHARELLLLAEQARSA